MTDLPVLLKYAEQFRGLHTNFTYAQKQSPHKFILLYSLRPLQKSPSPDSRNLNKDFRLFLFQISTDSTQIPPLIPLGYLINQASGRLLGNYRRT